MTRQEVLEQAMRVLLVRAELRQLEAEFEELLAQDPSPPADESPVQQGGTPAVEEPPLSPPAEVEPEEREVAITQELAPLESRQHRRRRGPPDRRVDAGQVARLRDQIARGQYRPFALFRDALK